ncbi:MAG: domain S-box protein [Cyanobacteria bacterium RYN_339]|nr:domain S-box protein [Cyanobacteria bacterium RYN_339]
MQEFCAYLRQNHLPALAASNLRRVRALDVPLMRLFAHVPEEQLLAMTCLSLGKFLDDLAEGRAFETAAENLRLWEADQLAGISKDAIEPTDLVLASAAQKNAILEFIPQFTREPERIMEIVLQLEDFYAASQADAFKLFTRLREELVTSATRREKELLLTNSQRILDLNDELQLQKAQAQEANRLKSEFLANMSHELRTPLNSILGYTDLVLKSKQPPLDEKHRANLQVVRRNGKHLLSLINNVLDLAKVESGRAVVYVEPLDARTFLQGLVTTTAPLARERGLELRLELAPALETVVTDETKLRQIVLNLLSNAIKFTTAGAVVLRARPDGAAEWLVEVEDTGVGIAPEHQQLVFEEFRQVDASSTRQQGGTGLGLAIARKLAQLLGGDLALASEPGRGSVFTLRLPLESVGEHAPTPAISTRVQANAPRMGGKLPVVTIDDDPEMLHLIAERLKDTPYVAVPASTGESGLQLVRELKPYAVILDIILPAKDGWTVLRELKGDPATADIPVLILSVAESKVLGYSLGAAAYMTKPVDQHALLATLERLGSSTPPGDGYVLVMEDDPDARGLYRELLGARGCRVVEAEDGTQGIAAIAHELPALIILDLMMPKMDGFEVLAWLRRQPHARHVPVVVVTARDLSADDRERLGEAQAVICKGELTEGLLVEELRTLAPRAQHVLGGGR